jgi:hypothetical protein
MKFIIILKEILYNISFIKIIVIGPKNQNWYPKLDDVINIDAKHNVYSFLNGYYRYHQISIAPEDIYKITIVIGSFYLGSDVVWNEKWTSYLSKGSK